MTEKICPFTNRECSMACALYICRHRAGCSITITAQILCDWELAKGIKEDK